MLRPANQFQNRAGLFWWMSTLWQKSSLDWVSWDTSGRSSLTGKLQNTKLFHRKQTLYLQMCLLTSSLPKKPSTQNTSQVHAYHTTYQDNMQWLLHCTYCTCNCVKATVNTCVHICVHRIEETWNAMRIAYNWKEINIVFLPEEHGRN